MAGQWRGADARKRADVPAIHALLREAETWMPGIADKFTQSAHA
jgi:hypothetical protein